jgi:oligoribonuclease
VTARKSNSPRPRPPGRPAVRSRPAAGRARSAPEARAAGAAGPPDGPRGDLLCWMDLEMTGLDPQQNVIVEIATLLTDNALQVVAEGPEIIVHADELQLSRMIEIVRDMHAKSGLTDKVRTSSVNLRDAELETLAFLKRWCLPRTAPLCGNSIWCDRMFLKHQMPAIDAHLHYRTIDVSSFKEVATRWSVAAAGGAPRKGDKHRALDDILESLTELRHYRDRWLAPPRKAPEGQAGAPDAATGGTADGATDRATDGAADGGERGS